MTTTSRQDRKADAPGIASAKLLTIDEFRRVFGYSEVDFREKGELRKFADSVPEEDRTHKGGIDFLAAQPITEPTIVVDISNVHYPDYYQSGNLSDLSKESPKPNTFPVVEQGVRYAFCFAANGMWKEDEKLFKKVRDLLVEAITVHGIGAKTGAGYGWFSDVTEIVEAENKAKAEADKAKHEAEEAKKKAEAEKAKEKDEDARRAALPPCERVLERWNSQPNLKAIVNGTDIAKFESRVDDDKKGIVEALRMPDGIGARVWAVVKGMSSEDPKKKLRNPKAETDVRSFCKNHADLFPATDSVKQGKMP